MVILTTSKLMLRPCLTHSCKIEGTLKMVMQAHIFRSVLIKNQIKLNDVTNESQKMYLERYYRFKVKNGSVQAIDVAMKLNYSKTSVSHAIDIKKSWLYYS